jgi:hypothetical protein
VERQAQIAFRASGETGYARFGRGQREGGLAARKLRASF